MSGAGRMSLASFLTAAATTLAVMRISGQHQHYDCPLANHLSPCICTEKERGLDISCSDIGALQLREVIDVIELTRQTVWFLRVTNAELRHFPKNLISGIDIKNLVILQCNVSTVDHHAFTGDLTKMESLDLAKNSLSSVPTRALSYLTSLAALNLDYNVIEVLERHSFVGLESLLWLSLYGNRIRIIDSRSFMGTEASLTRLNLGGNRLQEVPRYAVHRLNCLQGLRLHDNNITDVSLEFLPPSLCDLDLSGNNIEVLNASSFSVLPHLSSLDLEDNKIRTIHQGVFQGIEDSLEWLKLGSNEIASIPTQAFYNLSKLRQLDLRCNRIKTIEDNAFMPFGKSLKFIFLQKNNIRSIESNALEILKSVEWLYLHSNELAFLPYSTFNPVMENLHVLDLHGNPFLCNCDILWFRDWLLEKGANVVNLPKETRCFSPKEVAQPPIVRLTNSSFSCSGSSDITHKSFCHFLILISIWILSSYSVLRS